MSLAEAHNGRERLRIRVRGAVQGVGFRPFVHGLAARFRLSGFVLNDEDGVLAEVEGAALDGFLAALQNESPPLAHIDAVDVTPMPRGGQQGFAIRESVGRDAGRTRMVADAATCRSCLDELFDPASRFHLYPFVTCTHCGPRFTITRHLPYDRRNTSMAGFGLCQDCAADYADPASRRFHAETIACPVCGPRLSHPVEEIAVALRHGQIVALKGIGGFHLLCDATNERAVATLRRRKRRPAKPFAVMVANEASVEHIATPSLGERALLRQLARPAVLMRARAGLAPSVAPGLDRVAVMLPSAPVHHLLFHALAGEPKGAAWLDQLQPVALVATSANVAGEPLIIADAEALQALAGVADMIVTHDRPILMRADDSVMAVIDGGPAYVRRSRGFAPEPIDLGQDGPAVIAVGGHLKATLCVTRGREAFVSQHVGDLNTAAAIRFYEETARRMLTMLDVAPQLVACDLHPDYRSTRFAEAMDLPILRLQHHAAHLAAVAAEHHLRGPILGLALDGHGYGDDGSAWGGELMLLEGAGWRRLGHLRPLALPGGDRAAGEPWRMGVAALTALGRGAEAVWRFPGNALAGRLAAMLAANVQGPTTTSMGRLFDAAAALLGVCAEQSYEGQAAMQLEALVRIPRCLRGGYRITGDILDFTPLLASLLEPGLQAREGAELFHGTLVAGLAEWIGQGVARLGRPDVVLGGGCLANRVLAEGLTSALRARNLVAWLPRAAPANDGGLSLGQAAMARAHLIAERMPYRSSTR
ncbi:(NiFe) hydrogenase maturation protein HypF [Methylocella silvestris BL2]|uniref:Carbamoyltransferase HypF n=1 Tax=Methylocella silvestris (strain DSM 15510 / CIP 108128 / LMG 27833 / NCIMB 13906 / BL2) TaxID=395965 RepID=B8ERW6_METSB|nr:carbamoyltransferase HypF [Methylocella silvestris]ACK51664.1 (NiFe) hydrogenase maturation protein HypF [Methylocella silvestris BL2]